MCVGGDGDLDMWGKKGPTPPPYLIRRQPRLKDFVIQAELKLKHINQQEGRDLIRVSGPKNWPLMKSRMLEGLLHFTVNNKQNFNFLHDQLRLFRLLNIE